MGGAGSGGSGRSNLITGAAVTYAGGGGGGRGNRTVTVGAGGLGGGGNGGFGSTAAIAGTNGLGGGGGGGGAVDGTTYNGAAGGSGVVIVRYAGTALATGGTITSFVGNGTNGDLGVTYTVHSFTAVGTNQFAFDASLLSATISGNISGPGTLISDTSTSTLKLTGTNTYGDTTVETGTLQIGAGGAGATAFTPRLPVPPRLAFPPPLMPL